MITRPLDLVSKLRPAPRNFDALLYISVLMIGLQFSLFGSRFVRSPGLPANFAPAVAVSSASTQASLRVFITKEGVLVTEDGFITQADFPDWLKREALRRPDHSLLIVPDAGVSFDATTQVATIAQKMGFSSAFGYNAPVDRTPGGVH